MGWMQKLYETYEKCASIENSQSDKPLLPLFHINRQAHIEIVIDGCGKFRRAQVVERESTIIPSKYGSRSSDIAPHSLCDYLKYCAKDFMIDNQRYDEHHASYVKQLEDWCRSPHAHKKAEIVLSYVNSGKIIEDLINEKVLPVGGDGNLINKWTGKEKPPIMKQIVCDSKTKKYKLENALVRWVVETDLVPEIWKDTTLMGKWIQYCLSTTTDSAGLCMVSGVEQTLTDKHPRSVRNPKDMAKLISYKAENESNFIYLGRFTKAKQIVSIGAEISQKSHNALSWLIERQGFRNGDQAIVAWAVSGADIPDPFADTRKMFEIELQPDQPDEEETSLGDIGQAFSRRLTQRIAGYQVNLGPADDIVVMGLDSASTGRMAITYYRELTGSEFLARLKAWHETFAWPQTYSDKIKFVGAPSPQDIAEAAFGQKKQREETMEKLLKSTVERILPCIVDAQPLPRDLMVSAVRRVCNRHGKKSLIWEKDLGIACALFQGVFRERGYQMTLETERKTRDYLYGRLLALADQMESIALHIANEKRETNAARLMQRFADHPASTWRTLELALVPYMARLRENRLPFLIKINKLLDEVISSFQREDFINDTKLSGEFLLGYHCQRRELQTDKKRPSDTNEKNDLS